MTWTGWGGEWHAWAWTGWGRGWLRDYLISITYGPVLKGVFHTYVFKKHSAMFDGFSMTDNFQGQNQQNILKLCDIITKLYIPCINRKKVFVSSLKIFSISAK